MTRHGNRGLRLYTTLYLAFLYLPVLLLPIFSFNDSIYVALPIKGLTLQWWSEMAAQTGMHTALANSLVVAVPVAFASTSLGLVAVLALFGRERLPGAPLVTGLFTLPLVVPYIILGIALLILFNRSGIGLSLFSVGFGHTLICTPFALFVLMSRFEGLDPSLAEAALDLGETPWMAFWRVTFPIVLPGVMASLLLTFTISFDEFLLAFFLTGNDSTLPLYIFSQLRFPAKLPAVLALGSAILLATFAIVIVAERLRRRGLGSTGNTD
ncbi:MAG: ABC transporter permease [Hyphomicrobiaceae bacterium]